MTLCMAAICDDGNDGPKAVIASDRMVTLGGFMEFEHTVSKMKEATSCAVAMIAGDTLVGTRLAQGVGEEFKGASPDIAQIAVRLAQRYVEVRTGELEHQILNPRGLNLQGFYGAHQGLNAQIAAMIDQQMAQFNLGIELLLAGVDSQGAHIYSVTNPGQPDRQWDVIGYAAVGSGGIHAVQAMVGHRHSPSTPLRETIYQVFSSKRRSEVAPGVGSDTDMAIISASSITYLDEATLEKLDELYNNHGRTTEASLVSELEKLQLADGDSEASSGDE